MAVNLNEINKYQIKMLAQSAMEYFDEYFAIKDGLWCVFCRQQFIWIWGPVCGCHRPIRDPFSYKQ